MPHLLADGTARSLVLPTLVPATLAPPPLGRVFGRGGGTKGAHSSPVLLRAAVLEEASVVLGILDALTAPRISVKELICRLVPSLCEKQYHAPLLLQKPYRIFRET